MEPEPGLLAEQFDDWYADMTGGTLVDLACGRGGYGLEIAARTGARLVGVDFSAEAVRQAREHARRLGATAEFRGLLRRVIATATAP